MTVSNHRHRVSRSILNVVRSSSWPNISMEACSHNVMVSLQLVMCQLTVRVSRSSRSSSVKLKLWSWEEREEERDSPVRKADSSELAEA